MECANPNACTLDSTKLVQRIADWREVSSRAIARTVEDERIIATYPPDPHLLQQLRNLIAAEAECCAFLNFTIHEQETQTVVELVFPPEAQSLVDQVIAASVSPH